MGVGALLPGSTAPPSFAATGGRDAEGKSSGDARYRALFNAIDQGFCIIEMLFDGDDRPCDYRFLEVNAAFTQHTGLDDAVGKTILSLRPDHEKHWFEIYGRVALTGEPVRFEREAAALGRWYDVYAFRIDAPEQRRVAVLFRDITAQKRSDDRTRLLAVEADHRTKNLLSVIASMTRLMNAETVDAFRADLLGRIHAMARSQRMLAADNARGTGLREIVADELVPYRGRRCVTCDGPATTLDHDAVQPVALAIHELATNAAKYGALSVPAGRVAIEWSRRGSTLVICWRESGGPPVTVPTRMGLGTTVVTMGIRDQLGGAVTFDWNRDGLRCEMIVPMKA